MIYFLRMTDTRTFEHAVTVDAPRDQVFRALTDAGELKRWWITDGISEPRTGGRFRYEWKAADPANDHVQEGTYDEVVDGERVSYPWSLGPAGDSRVSFSVSERDAATEVTLRHSGFPDDPAHAAIHERHDQGWHKFLTNLKSVLEGGADNRAEMGIKAPART
jgi:uncharacterized protein YndB with AHSA1/START domain